MTSLEPAPADLLKERSRFLRGKLAESLQDDSAPFDDDDAAVLKFHGIYQEDDRDVRSARRRAGLEPDWIFMTRAAIPGGVVNAEQWLVMDALADEVGDGTLRITSRQGIQWHHTRKRDLGPLLTALNRSLITTLGACGDVVRNVMSCPAPLAGREELRRVATALAAHFRPRSRSYYEVWIDGERAVTAAPREEEPIYGATYLPRKFKIALAHPGDNCVDVYSDDVGIVPEIRDGGVVRYNVLVGGGMGRSHNKPDTFPRLADPLGTVAPERLLELVEAVVLTHRDFGERHDRKHARLKYLVEYWGIDDFRMAVERRLGWKLEPPVPLAWRSATDHLGWHRQPDGNWFVGIAVTAGRVGDSDGLRLRSAVRDMAAALEPGIHLTASQNLLLSGIPEKLRDTVENILAAHGVAPAERLTPVVRSAMACVALPTCSLAVTDAERALPRIVAAVAAELEAAGLARQDVTVRITGCPNGCARPYNAEIGLVGRRMGRYDIHVGGSDLGTRLNTLVAEAVPEESIAALLRPLFDEYHRDRLPGEALGDFCDRVSVVALTQEVRA